MMKKRWMGILLAVATAFSLAACSQSSTQSTTQAQTADDQTETVQSTTESTQAGTDEVNTSGEASSESSAEETDDSTQAAGGKTLVVYYSASGHTKAVAEDIAEAAGADLFEIVPEEPYTDADLDWTDDNSRVTREHEDESLREVALTTTEVPDWDSYDTVLIGYPIWWAIAAWPVDGFVKANDFTGKTVIPFCTSTSSGLGQSGELLAEMAGTGDWQEGMRFRSSASAEDVQEWVNSLGL